MEEHENTPIGWLLSIYKKVDELLGGIFDKAERDGRGKVACRGSGCSFCCYDVSACTPLEMFAAIDYASRLSSEENAIIDRQYMAYMDAHVADGTLLPVVWYDEYKSWDIPATTRTSVRRGTPCMFLHPETRECMIYEVRPLACRCHHSLNKAPDMCNDRIDMGAVVELKRIGMGNIQSWFLRVMLETGIPATPYGELHSMFHEFIDPDNQDRRSVPGFDVEIRYER